MDFKIDEIIVFSWKMPDIGLIGGYDIAKYLPKYIEVPATIFNAWIVMAVLSVIAWLATRRLTSSFEMSKWQNLMEVVIKGIRDQIREVCGQDPKRFLPFIGTLFLFIFVSNLMAIIPGFVPPTASLSTTASFGICVFFAVPLYGISSVGVKKYFKQYVEPFPAMLPMNIISEFARTLSLSVRLFGNILSGVVIGLILLSLAPYFVPVIMSAMGILTGTIHAYIFPVLAMVYIASALQTSPSEEVYADSVFGAEIEPEAKFEA
ncbi:MAG: F0F1 ATP synthase subunit A [Alphaproteobacteria bacterium]